MRSKKLFLRTILFLAMCWINPLQAADLTQNFNFDGYLLDGSGNPIVGPVAVKFQIYNSALTCLLYEESHAGVNPGTDGAFSLKVGAGTRASVGVDGGNSYKSIFQNDNALSVPSCGTFTPVSGEQRKLRVTVGATVLTPEYSMSAVPMATVAETLQGKVPSDFMSVNPNYSFPAADGTSNYVMKTDGSGNLSWVDPSTFASGVSSITAGTGLTGGTITSSGTIAVDTELAGLNSLASTGYVKRTGVGTYSASAINLTSDVSGILPIANGGTGSSTQNFVDLSNAQTIAGAKTFSGTVVVPNTGAGANEAATKSYVDAAVVGGSGEINTASNVGTGQGIYYQKTGADLEFKGIAAGPGMVVSTSGNDVVIEMDSAGAVNSNVMKWNGSNWVPAFNSSLTHSNSNTVALNVDTSGVVSIANSLGVGTATPNEVITSEGRLSLKEVAAGTSTPNYGKIYVKSADSKLYYMDDSGAEFDISSPAVGAVTSVEGATGAIDLVNTIASGTDAGPTWSTSGSNITLNIPLANDAATTSGGLLTKAQYDVLNAKQPFITNGTSTSQYLKWDGDSWEPTYVSSLSSPDGTPSPALSIDIDGIVSVTGGHIVSSGDNLADKDYVDASTGTAVADVTGGNGIIATDTAGIIDIDLNVDDSTVEVNADTLRVKALGIGTGHLAADSVTTAKIADASVTPAKLVPGGNTGQMLFWHNGSSSWMLSDSTVPSNGQVLMWDTTLNGSTGGWRAATPAGGATGDIEDVIAGAGLSGGSATGSANLDVNVDNATIEINSDVIQVKDNGITSAKLANSSILPSKLANGTANGQLMFWNNVATTWQYIDTTGLADQKVLTWDATLNAGAGGWKPSIVSAPGLATPLASGQIYVGNVSSVATPVNPSGDVSMTNTGAFTVANNAITTAKIADGNVTFSKLANGGSVGDILKWNGAVWQSVADAGLNSAGGSMTGNLGIVAGSPAAPGLFFAGDSNTGITSGAADRLDFVTNGSSRVSIDSFGKVGIGTATPTSKLHLFDTSSPYVESAMDSGGPGSLIMGVSRNANGLGMGEPAHTAFIDNSNNTPIFFMQNGANRMVIDGSGYVGIGTTAPTADLDVQGEIKAQGVVLTGAGGAPGTGCGGMAGKVSYHAGSNQHVFCNGTDWKGMADVIAPDLSGSNATGSFVNSNVITISTPATTINLSGILDGGEYKVVLINAPSNTYNFSGACSQWKYKTPNGVTTVSTDTIYKIQRVGTICYVDWASGYN